MLCDVVSSFVLMIIMGKKEKKKRKWLFFWVVVYNCKRLDCMGGIYVVELVVPFSNDLVRIWH